MMSHDYVYFCIEYINHVNYLVLPYSRIKVVRNGLIIVIIFIASMKLATALQKQPSFY